MIARKYQYNLRSLCDSLKMYVKKSSRVYFRCPWCWCCILLQEKLQKIRKF